MRLKMLMLTELMIN